MFAMNKQQLAAKIWESANKMRSKIEANEYKDYILGFIFYKYLSEQEERFLYSNDYTAEIIRDYVNETDTDSLELLQNNLGYFISYEDLFSTWINMGSDFSIDNVRTALSSFTRLISPTYKEVFKDIFNTLETGLKNLGDTAKTQTKAVSDLIHLIDDIPMDQKMDYDVLGFIYEYLLDKFAANAGKKAGEFYTPHEVSCLMADIIANHLRGRDNIDIYDPTSGSGSLLITIGHAVAKYMNEPDKIHYYAQELKQNTYNLTRMNLVMRGIIPSNITARNGDTLEDDWPMFDESDPVGTYHPLYVDAVVSNPPYSQQWDPSGKESDPRYSRYGLAPKSKADYAFLLHDLYHLRPNGIMTIVLPHGVLFRGGEEGEIRKNLIENDNIEAIIGLPANIFFGTGIPTIIMVLRQKREASDVLIIDASHGFIKEGKNNKLRACDIRKIVDTFVARKDVPRYARVVTKEEIRDNGYNLNIPRYVDSSEAAEHWDIYATMFGGIPECELQNFSEYWQQFKTLKSALFISDGKYASLRQADIKDGVWHDADVQAFLKNYTSCFGDLGDMLKKILVQQAESLPVIKTEDDLTKDLFQRFQTIPLVDPYAGYELFYQQYQEIANDLEIIQSEGIEAVKQVDPNMVIKKRKGKEAEVQEGWKGHILPFSLVQKYYFPESLANIEQLKDELQAISSAYEEILEGLSEDEQVMLSPVLSENNDKFVMKEVTSSLKTLKNRTDDDAAMACQILERGEALAKREKTLKKAIRDSELRLEEQTKKEIETLDDEKRDVLLYEKWVVPICQGIADLPVQTLNDFVKKLEALKDKYAVTLVDVEKDIVGAETALSKMLNDLTGSDEDMAGLAEWRKLLGGK